MITVSIAEKAPSLLSVASILRRQRRYREAYDVLTKALQGLLREQLANMDGRDPGDLTVRQLALRLRSQGAFDRRRFRAVVDLLKGEGAMAGQAVRMENLVKKLIACRQTWIRSCDVCDLLGQTFIDGVPPAEFLTIGPEDPRGRSLRRTWAFSEAE